MAIQYPPAEAGPSTAPTGRQPGYRLSHSLGGHARAVTALEFTRDGKTLVSAGADGYLHLWDSATGAHKRSLRCHRTGINDISLSPDGLYVATASDDTTSVIHSIAPLSHPAQAQPPARIPAPLRSLSAHTAPVLAIAFSPKSNLLATGSFDESAVVWDVRRGKALKTLPAHAEAIWTVGWDPEGVMVVTGGADGLIRLWDANSGQCLKTLDNETNSPVSFAAFTPSPFFLLSVTLSSTVRLHNIHTGKVHKTLRAPSYISERYFCPAVVFAPPRKAREADGMEMEVQGEGKSKEAWVVTGSENGKMMLWELRSRRVLQVLEVEGVQQRPIVAIAVHPDGRTIATGALEPEKVIHIWRDDA